VNWIGKIMILAPAPLVGARLAGRAGWPQDAPVIEVVKNPIAYFLAMIAVFSVASLPCSPPTLMAAKVNPPWLIATLGAVAASLAAGLDYYLVRRAFRRCTLKSIRRHRLFERAERSAKVAPFFTVALFAAVPLPFMIPRVMVPLSGYPLPRYAAAVAVGRWLRVFVVASFGRLVDVPAWMLDAALLGSVAVVTLGALFHRLGWIGRAPPPPSERGAAAMEEPPEPPAPSAP
jgi:uncharacterized membrane protein YdjX (TVP38/TMEM64 family)